MINTGLFNTNKINIKKELQDNSLILYVDIHKLNNPVQYKSDIMVDIIGDNCYLVVINSNLEYTRDNANFEKVTGECLKWLEEHNINYRQVVENKDTYRSILGVLVRMGNKVKDKDFSVGFVVTKKEFEKIQEKLAQFNLYYYVVQNGDSNDKALNSFSETRGNIEEMSKLFINNFYYDRYVQKLRISMNKENEEAINQILSKHLG